MELPPRFSPDNSEEARKRRIEAHRYAIAKVTELPLPKHRVTDDPFAYDHAMCYVKTDNVVPIRQDIPDIPA